MWTNLRQLLHNLRAIESRHCIGAVLPFPVIGGERRGGGPTDEVVYRLRPGRPPGQRLRPRRSGAPRVVPPAHSHCRRRRGRRGRRGVVTVLGRVGRVRRRSWGESHGSISRRRRR